eukprot:15446617-Alexandrium_andersonii.AAC.1
MLRIPQPSSSFAIKRMIDKDLFTQRQDGRKPPRPRQTSTPRTPQSPGPQEPVTEDSRLRGALRSSKQVSQSQYLLLMVHGLNCWDPCCCKNPSVVDGVLAHLDATPCSRDAHEPPHVGGMSSLEGLDGRGGQDKSPRAI